MITSGQFILVSTDEFATWLMNVSVKRNIVLVQNHHTYAPAYAQFSGKNHFDLLKGMKAFHTQPKEKGGRGFSDIAQSLTIFPDGKVSVCRPLDVAPAGIIGANSNGICIENIGNFDEKGDVMTEEQTRAIIKVNALLCKKFHLVPSINTIVYHHWYDLNTGKRTNGSGSTKSCPGTNFFGGNSTDDANNYFIPLIKEAL